jgi:hypothetical protein
MTTLPAAPAVTRVTSQGCPDHGGPPVTATIPWHQVRRCGPDLSAFIVGGRVVSHISDPERAALAAELIAGITPGWWPA